MAFTKETFDFLADLAANNSRDWFEANRSRYEAHWRDAALDYIAAVSSIMGSLDPPLRAEAKLNGSLRRINRDVRFSKDKSPYDARLHMVFWHGSHPNRSPGVHIVLMPDGVAFGAGQFGLTPEQLTEIRNRMVDPADGDALIAALDAAETVGCRMPEPDLKRLPKGYEAEGRRAELLRYKAIVVRSFDTLAPKDVLIGDVAPEWTQRTTEALVPLVRWLSAG